jgi:hypothetical protein
MALKRPRLGTCARARDEGFACTDERLTTVDGFVLEVHRIPALSQCRLLHDRSPTSY